MQSCRVVQGAPLKPQGPPSAGPGTILSQGIAPAQVLSRVVAGAYPNAAGGAGQHLSTQNCRLKSRSIAMVEDYRSNSSSQGTIGPSPSCSSNAWHEIEAAATPECLPLQRIRCTALSAHAHLSMCSSNLRPALAILSAQPSSSIHTPIRRHPLLHLEEPSEEAASQVLRHLADSRAQGRHRAATSLLAVWRPYCPGSH